MSNRVVPAGTTEVERVQRTQVQVENFGTEVTVRDEMHAKANHYIKESRPYFPNEKLPTYIDCPYFLRMARILCVASIFGILTVFSVSKFIAVFFFAACLLFFLIYCQHQWVNQKSLPIVFRQPVIPSQRKENDFYKLTVTELDGIALQNYQAGVGFIQLSQGEIKFQAFNKTAMKYMTNAKGQSRLMMVLFAVAFAFNATFWYFSGLLRFV